MEYNSIKLSKDQRKIIIEATKMIAGVIVEIIAENLFGR